MYLGWRLRSGAARWFPVALLGWVGGTALQSGQAALWPWWAYGLAALLGALGSAALLAGPAVAPARRLAMFLAFALLAWGQMGVRAAAFQARALQPALEGRDLQVTGIVAAMPQPGADGLRMQMRIESARLAGAPVAVPPRVLLGWYAAVGADTPPGAASALPVVWAGERWEMTVRLKAPHGNLNPHSFDYELWLWEHGLQGTGYVRAAAGPDAPRRLGQTWRHPVELARQHVRQRIDARLQPSGRAGWISALVTGDQHAIDRADWDVFRATGVAHLMSISGLHITMFAWLAARLIDLAWRRSRLLCLRLPAPHAALLGGLLLAWSYALFSGWGVPSQRTVCMLAVVCLLRLSGRSWPWSMTWLLAGGIVLAFDPWALQQAGFWLSFVAVGVLFASGRGDEPMRTGAVAHLRSMLREQWTITLALTPLVLLLFREVSLVGFGANLLAIPWVTLVVTPLAMLGVVAAPAWDLAALAVVLLAGALGWLAGLPFATLTVAAAPAPLGAAAVLGGWLLALRVPMPFRLAGAALVLPVLLWQPPRPAAGSFTLLAADVGQGNAILVQTARHALLYDAGPRYSRDSDAGHRVLVPLLRSLGTELDLLVLSHRDSDHVGGAEPVLAMHPGARLLASIEPEHGLWAIRPGQRCEAGQRWQWDGVLFTVLHPQPQDYAGRATSSNGLSCVLRVSVSGSAGAGPVSALLTGDIEAAQEARLLRDGALLQAALLLVPHHGSKTSSSAAFLDAVAPQVALVQSGYRNRFGHPAAVPMARYAERQILVVDSPHCGAMHWSSARPGEVVCQRVADRRYWQHAVP